MQLSCVLSSLGFILDRSSLFLSTVSVYSRAHGKARVWRFKLSSHVTNDLSLVSHTHIGGIDALSLHSFLMEMCSVITTKLAYDGQLHDRSIYRRLASGYIFRHVSITRAHRWYHTHISNLYEWGSCPHVQIKYNAAKGNVYYKSTLESQ